MTDRDAMILQIMNSEILCNDCGESTASYCAEAIVDLLIANGMAVQRWIPVTERLPENDTAVWVYRPTMAIKMMQSYYYNGFCEGRFNIYGEEVITHWMPLPDAPKTCADCKFYEKECESHAQARTIGQMRGLEICEIFFSKDVQKDGDA